ncbi:hypothetical protein NP493_13g08018 [Ridgeia piscesae]|uniref:Uncharacterized protein n=1 Tax=Ridgeia piscesae TaxID=27915 RepID=A0AAD9UL10_RIDPI|nr:hypothetical protein NP493_13g08018 [Ridgeia piscesae]
MDDAIDGSVNMPFTSRAAWHAIQLECPDLRRTHAHLIQGIRPLKKFTKVGDVKRYLRTVSVANDGVLIVRDNQPFQPPRERIVVPRSMVDVFLTTLHIRFCHPSRNQLKRISNRYFLALDFDKASEATSVACHQCQAVKSIPVYLRPQSFTQAPTVYSSRAGNHAHSAKAKAHGHNSPPAISVSLGDLVYVKGDRDKCRARDKYIVTKLLNAEGWCYLKKFTTSQIRSKTYDVRISDCYTLTPALPNKPPDGPIRGQDMCSDSSSDSEPGSSEATSPDQVVAAEQPALPPLPPPPEAIVVHPTTPAADHTAEPSDSSCAPTRRCERTRQRPR